MYPYLFPEAIATNHYEQGGLKQQKFVLTVLEAEVQNQDVTQVGSFLLF